MFSLKNLFIFDRFRVAMAKSKSKKATGGSKDAKPKYLGVKLHDGQKAKTGQILVRQRGTKFVPGENVSRGGDDTLYALLDGIVRFETKKIRGFDNRARKAKIVNVVEEN